MEEGKSEKIHLQLCWRDASAPFLNPIMRSNTRSITKAVEIVTTGKNIWIYRLILPSSAKFNDEMDMGAIVAPVSVNVANKYSASVEPASEWAPINKLYQVPG